jgi:CheY-like chemotaxis protein
MGNVPESLLIEFSRGRRIHPSLALLGFFLLMLALWFPGSGRAGDRSLVQGESSPIVDDPAQAAWLRQKAKESQERFRLRVEIPRAALKSSLAEESALAENPIGGRASAPLPGSGSLSVQNLTLGAFFCLAGVLAVLKLAPEQVEKVAASLSENQSSRDRQAQRSVKALDDERVFAEFLIAFKAGPRAKRSNEKAGARPECENSVGGTSNCVDPPADVLKTFCVAAPPRLMEMRTLLGAVGRQEDPDSRKLMLKELCALLAALKEAAAAPELLPVWQVTSAVEGLVAQLTNKPGNVTPNTLRTVASGLDLLSDLCQRGFRSDLSTKPPIRLLAVDDDMISRHAVAVALKKAFHQPDLAANSEAALAQASMISYDAIFLDVLMPGMDGFELCSSIRQSSINRLTPIIFVTSQGDFEARTTSNICGGSDLIAKPFLTFEITVKALVFALRARLEKQKAQALETGPSKESPVAAK